MTLTTIALVSLAAGLFTGNLLYAYRQHRNMREMQAQYNRLKVTAESMSVALSGSAKYIENQANHWALRCDGMQMGIDRCAEFLMEKGLWEEFVDFNNVENKKQVWH